MEEDREELEKEQAQEVTAAADSSAAVSSAVAVGKKEPSGLVAERGTSGE